MILELVIGMSEPFFCIKMVICCRKTCGHNFFTNISEAAYLNTNMVTWPEKGTPTFVEALLSFYLHETKCNYYFTSSNSNYNF